VDLHHHDNKETDTNMYAQHRQQCQWAGCNNPATTYEDGYYHCDPDVTLHRMFANEELGYVAEETVEGLHALGLDDLSMSVLLGVSYIAVQNRRAKLGLKPHPSIFHDDLEYETITAKLTRKQDALEQKKLRTPLQACGTNAAYRRHKANNETPCDPCINAGREMSRIKSRRERAARVLARNNGEPIIRGPRKKDPETLLPCGTNAAYRRHMDAGEPSCAPCRDAERIRSADARSKREAKKDIIVAAKIAAILGKKKK
jgi:hypothetical protein